MKDLKPCPCGGDMKILNDQRHLKQQVSRERFELVCSDCGLTVKHPSKSLHKLIKTWNTRADSGLVTAVRQTLEENCHLADGDDCTLFVLREALALYDSDAITAWNARADSGLADKITTLTTTARHKLGKYATYDDVGDVIACLTTIDTLVEAK